MSRCRRIAGLAGSRTGVLVSTTVGTLVVRMASTVVLTRLLSPEAFGVVGIIMSIFVVITLLTDLGFQAFVIRHERGDEPHFLDVIWTIHVTRGIALCLLTAALSPVFALLFAKPALGAPLAAASLTLAFSGLTSLSLMNALRHDGARKLSLFDFALQAYQSVICIALALWWRNIWALIAAMVIQQATRAVLSYALFPGAWRRIVRDPVISREFATFSRVTLATSFLTLLLAQTDKLVLARLFTLPQFGLYSIALTIALAPMGFAQSFVARVLYPACARIWRDAPQAIAETYYKVRRRAGLLYGLGCGGLIGGAPALIAILYDPRYAGAALYVSILTFASALRFPNLASADMMTAIGQIRVTLRMNIVRVLWLIVAGSGGFAFAGPLGLIAAVGSIEVPAALYGYFTLHRAGLLRTGEELGYLGVVAAGAAIGLAAERLLLAIVPSL